MNFWSGSTKKDPHPPLPSGQKAVLTKSGIDIFKAHSVRSATVSAAANAGVLARTFVIFAVHLVTTTCTC